MGIKWSDVFYPGNPERRRKVIQLTQKLYDAMQANFRATNRFIDFLNAQFKNCNLKHIKVNEERTLKENAEILMRAIEEIQNIIERVDRQLKDQLDPDLYRKLTDVDLSFQEKIKTAENVMHIVAEVVATAAAIVVCIAIVSFGVLAPVVAVIGVVATCALADVVIRALSVFAVGAIVGAITGTIERENLESAISDLEEMSAKFIPASEDYNDSIYDVLAEVKMDA